MATVLTKFSYSEGDYGHRVRVFSRPGRKSLYIEFWDPTGGKMVVRSLEHADAELARQQCRSLSDSIRLGNLEIEPVPITSPTAQTNGNSDAVPAQGAAVQPVSSTRPAAEATIEPTSLARAMGIIGFIGWKRLFREYHAKRGQFKKGTGPREGQRRAMVWVAYFRSRKITDPSLLDDDEMLAFVRARMAGTIRTPFVELKKTVISQTAWADTVYLVTVLRWATRAKDPRLPQQKLLARNDLQVPPGLKNKNPQRPRANHDDSLSRRRVANSIDSQGLFRDYERLHDEIGWRVTGMCHISAADVCLEPQPDMPYGFIAKNEHVDKEGCGQRVPLSRRGAAIVRSILRKRGIKAGQQAWLFPAKLAPGKPWDRWHVGKLERRAEAAAQIKHMGGTHAVRRKWVSERKGHPIKDIMVAGGWNDPRSLDAYMLDDEKTTYEVVSQPTRRIRRPGAPRAAK